MLRFPQTVAIGPDGNVYVGDQSSSVVQVFDPLGTFLREVGRAGVRPGELGSVGAIAVAGDNTLFVAEGTNRIDRFDAAGNLVQSFGKGGNGVGEFHFGAGGGNDAPAGGGLAVSGNLLFVSDSFNDRIQRFNLDGSGGAEIVAPGTLAYPRGLTVDGQRLLVADDKHHRIAVFDIGGRPLTTFGSGPGAGPGQFNFPFGVAVDPAGRVFVADDLNHRVVRFGPKSAYPYKARWGHYGTEPGGLAYPRAIAVDAAGTLYVTNTGNDRIDVFDRSGGLLRSFGASGRANGQFNTPLGVGADASGIRAVADSVNGRVQLLNPDGSIATVWGSVAPGPTILRNPVAVAFDAAGNGYVLDKRRARILVFSRATGPARPHDRLAGLGSRQAARPVRARDHARRHDLRRRHRQRARRALHDRRRLPRRADRRRPGGRDRRHARRRRACTSTTSATSACSTRPATAITEFGGLGNKIGKLAAPAQIALDGAGNLWVADRGNNRVQQFGPNGERLLTFGARGVGPGQFINPTGVSVDCRGTLTVTDTQNNRVQQFALAAPPAVACAALGPLGNPPPPKLPTLPLPLGPQVTVRALRSNGPVHLARAAAARRLRHRLRR